MRTVCAALLLAIGAAAADGTRNAEIGSITKVFTAILLAEGLPRLPDNIKPMNPMNPYADYTVENMFEFLGRYQLPRDIGAKARIAAIVLGNSGVGHDDLAFELMAGK